MKIEANNGNHSLTMTTESKEDFFKVGKISAFLGIETFSNGDKISIYIPFDKLIKALSKTD